MKIRIKGNSVRLRLTKSEVNKFCENGVIAETTNFGNAVFSYKLIADTSSDKLKASFDSNEIALFLPKSKIGAWNTNDVIGFTEQFELDNGQNLLLKIEKDFVCLDETEEDQTDNYPNPRLTNN